MSCFYIDLKRYPGFKSCPKCGIGELQNLFGNYWKCPACGFRVLSFSTTSSNIDNCILEDIHNMSSIWEEKRVEIDTNSGWDTDCDPVQDIKDLFNTITHNKEN